MTSHPLRRLFHPCLLALTLALMTNPAAGQLPAEEPVPADIVAPPAAAAIAPAAPSLENPAVPPPVAGPPVNPNVPSDEALAAALREVPPLPRNHVLDYGNMFSIEDRKDLSERLLNFKEKQGLLVYLYVFAKAPELPVRDMIIALRESWLNSAPLAGGVFVIPGSPAQLFCVIGGKDSGQYPVQVLLDKGYNAAKVAEAPAPIQEKVILATQRLVEEVGSLKAVTVEPDALLIKKSGPVNITRWWAGFWGDMAYALTSVYFYIGLVVVGLTVFLWALTRWLNRSRRYYFPRVKPRARFDGLYSGGNNAVMAFIGKRNTERAQQAEEEKLSLPGDDV